MLANSGIQPFHTTYQARVYVTASGHSRMSEVLGLCQKLYNEMLEHRDFLYQLTGHSVSLYDQNAMLTRKRAEEPGYAALSVSVERGVLRRLDKAYKAFFRRVKAGEKPGFPRFKSWRRFETLELAGVEKGMVKQADDGRTALIKVKGLPRLKIKTAKRPLPGGVLKGILLTRKPIGWYVSLQYEVARNRLPAAATDAVGIDMGVNQRLTLSTGEAIIRRDVDLTRENELRVAVERSTRRDSLGRVSGPQSNRRAKRLKTLTRETYRKGVRNRNACHRITSDLVGRFGRIGVEDLRILNMTKRAKKQVAGVGIPVGESQKNSADLRVVPTGSVADGPQNGTVTNQPGSAIGLRMATKTALYPSGETRLPVGFGWPSKRQLRMALKTA